MRIALATTQIPFISGGAEYLTSSLKKALIQAGHEVEIIAVPFQPYPSERIPEHILACRLLDVTESAGTKIDLLIGTKFPAYYLRHPNKILWIMHQHKQAYELFETEYSDLGLSTTGLSTKEAIIRADNLYLKEARRIFTISKNVSARLSHFNRISSTPIYPPCPAAEKFRCEAYKDYIFLPSRLETMKRTHLAVEAMRYVKTPIKLYLAGSASTPSYKDYLKKIVNKHHLQEKVKFWDFISDEQKNEFYANCRAVIFPPYEEDYGYVTLEAFYSSKAVITCWDSSGPLEFVKDKETGFVCEPDSIKIADAINALGGSEDLARQMGEKARERIMEMDISWDHVVKELTAV